MSPPTRGRRRRINHYTGLHLLIGHLRLGAEPELYTEQPFDQNLRSIENHLHEVVVVGISRFRDTARRLFAITEKSTSTLFFPKKTSVAQKP